MAALTTIGTSFLAFRSARKLFPPRAPSPRAGTASNPMAATAASERHTFLVMTHLQYTAVTSPSKRIAWVYCRPRAPRPETPLFVVRTGIDAPGWIEQGPLRAYVARNRLTRRV